MATFRFNKQTRAVINKLEREQGIKLRPKTKAQIVQAVAELRVTLAIMDARVKLREQSVDPKKKDYLN